MIIATMNAAELAFDPVKGIGYYPVTGANYDQAYFDKYVAMGATTFGVALNSLRVGLVSKYIRSSEELIDIGIGDGAFIRMRGGSTGGYDVNPVGEQLLRSRGEWCDVRQEDSIYAASFWDSLEHIDSPGRILAKVETYCFVSIPVFSDLEHILGSKHYRPTEHYWYFTKAGLIDYFWQRGFACLEMNDMETSLGREDIGTFVFRRI